ncbi:hypothetical protein BBD26_0229 [Lactobacillus delbrueckii subsp. bulgaricus]|nr:hypothetical protein BBD26_0229 [Lactobacillus delbrueckii subsp. bulgaricus]
MQLGQLPGNFLIFSGSRSPAGLVSEEVPTLKTIRLSFISQLP